MLAVVGTECTLVVNPIIIRSRSQRDQFKKGDVAEGFRVAGLGLWVEAMLSADRFLEFG